VRSLRQGRCALLLEQPVHRCGYAVFV
jgi:hypothetical protein